MKKLKEIVIEQTCMISAITQVLVDKGVFKEDELVMYIKEMRKMIHESVDKSKQEEEEALMKQDPFTYAIIKGIERIENDQNQNS